MSRLFVLRGVVASLLLCLAAASQAVAGIVDITRWDFNNTPAGSDTITTSPAPTTGSGVAASLGMTNTYGGVSSTDQSDVFQAVVGSTDAGSSDPNVNNNNIWRIRANATGSSTGNGWNSAAPQFTQGAQFSVNTTGFTGVGLTFDWEPTKQGVADLQVQYSLDGKTFTNIGGVIDAVNGTQWYNGNTVSFAGIAGAANDPNFAIRLVSAYHGTTGAYTNTTGTALNNTSGNWRFDEVAITGLSAVPEPSSIALTTLGLAAIGVRQLRSRRKAS